MNAILLLATLVGVPFGQNSISPNMLNGTTCLKFHNGTWAQICSPRNGVVIIENAAGTAGVTLDVSTDATLSVFARDGSSAAVLNVGSIGSGTTNALVMNSSLGVNNGMTCATGKPVHTAIYAGASSTTTATVDAANGPSQSLSLAAATGNVTVTFTGFVAGDTLALTVIQHASAPQNITSWNGGTFTTYWPYAAAPTITAVNSAQDEVSCHCSATNVMHCTSSQYYQAGP